MTFLKDELSLLSLINGSESDYLIETQEAGNRWQFVSLCYLYWKIGTIHYLSLYPLILFLFSRYQGCLQELNHNECNCRVKKRMFLFITLYNLMDVFNQNIFITCLTQYKVDLTYSIFFKYNTEMLLHWIFMHYNSVSVRVILDMSWL